MTKKINLAGLETKVLFLFQFALTLSIYGTNISYINPIANILQAVSIVVLSMIGIRNLLRNNVKKNEALIFLLLFVASILVTVTSGNATIMYYTIMVFAIYKRSAREVLMRDMKVKIMAVMFVIMCYCLGQVITGDSVYRGHEIRQAWGFTHPNTLGGLLMIIFSEFTVLFSLRKNLIKYLLILAAIVPILAASDSRTATIAIIALILINIIWKSAVTDKNKIIIAIVPIVIVTSSLLITLAYSVNGYFAVMMNGFLNHRIEWQSYYLEDYEIGILGRQISFADHPLDNGYIRYLVNYGAMGLLIVLALIIRSVVKNNNPTIRNVQLLFIIYTISESITLSAIASPIWLLSVCESDWADFKKEKNVNEKKGAIFRRKLRSPLL